MPRRARHWRDGSVQHIVSRFVDREFCIEDDADRHAYLGYIEQCRAAWDWCLLAFAIMSSHLHFGAIAGKRPLGPFFQRLHTSFARYFHARYRGLGPVLADRPKNYQRSHEDLPRVVAYIHRNPVDAGVVSLARESRWTSHRAYLRLDPAPPWLDVERGLALLGFDDTASGRAEFDEFVNEVDLASYPREARVSRSSLDDWSTPVACEISRDDWDLLLGLCAELCGVSEQRVHRSRDHGAAQARRVLAAVACGALGQSYSRVARLLDSSPSTIHSLVQRIPPSVSAESLMESVQEVLCRFEGERSRGKEGSQAVAALADPPE